jgi:hypothetical protein
MGGRLCAGWETPAISPLASTFRFPPALRIGDAMVSQLPGNESPPGTMPCFHGENSKPRGKDAPFAVTRRLRQLLLKYATSPRVAVDSVESTLKAS